MSVILEMTDGTVVHVGDKRRLTATVTDSADAAAEPTQIVMVCTPDAAPSSATTYAKTASGSQVAMTSVSSGIYYADHTFSVAGWWNIVTTGSGNMTEVDRRRIFVEGVS